MRVLITKNGRAAHCRNDCPFLLKSYSIQTLSWVFSLRSKRRFRKAHLEAARWVMRTSFEPQSVLHQFPVTDILAPQSTVCTPISCCTCPDHLTTTHSLNGTRARLRHASALLVTSCEVSVNVFRSLSWSLCSQCVARTDRSESSRGVSVETHFILVTPGSIRLLT